jgi:hypothetical protein
LKEVIIKYVGRNVSLGDHAPWSVELSDFQHAVRQEFPNNDPFSLLDNGEFHEVFTIVEIFLNMATGISYTRRVEVPIEIQNAFHLSGSVYSISGGNVVLNIETDLAKKIEEAKEILAPYESWYKTFFEAVGDLVGRRAKASDVVKNIFIAAEGYLKEKTGKTRFSEAVNQLNTSDILNREQKAILEKLYAYRSDAAGAGHAGNSAEPTEVEALWYLETMLAQLRHIHRRIS